MCECWPVVISTVWKVTTNISERWSQVSTSVLLYIAHRNGRNLIGIKTVPAYKSARSKIHKLYKAGLLFPVVSTKIRKRVILPSALYVCQIWTTLSNEDIWKLEYIQWHFPKTVHGFSIYPVTLSRIFNFGDWIVLA